MHTPFSLSNGTILQGRYRIVRPLKSGGMGAVYEAVHVETQRRRALKVMLPGTLHSEELRGRFKREATVAAEVRSDHIVEVIDAGEDQETGFPFLVMELLEGEELASMIDRRGPLPPPEVVEYLRQAALGLAQTHALGVVHRDLKPDNLFVTCRDDGTPEVKILDWGIAKVVSGDSLAKTTKGILGTPLYIAPEQIHGEAPITPRTDVYAMAQIAFTLLTGQAYFSKEQQALENAFPLLMKVVKGPAQPPSERAAERSQVMLPATFNDWFERAAAVDPVARFGSAGEAVRQLATALGLPDAAACDTPALPPYGSAPAHAGSALTHVDAATQSPPLERHHPSQPSAPASDGTRRVHPPSGGGGALPSPLDSTSPRGTLLLTDLVVDLGDDQASELRQGHAQLVQSLLESHGGREIDQASGLLLLFDHAIDALCWALAYHDGLRKLPAPPDGRFTARAVVVSGTLTQTVTNESPPSSSPPGIEGDALRGARRVMSLARPGQTLLTAEAHHRVERALEEGEGIVDGAVTVDHGLYLLKGVEQPVGIIEVGIADVAPLCPPEDGTEAYQVVELTDGGLRPARELPNNLPRELSSFVGRRAELRELVRRFDEGAALVTVVGPAGTGKTRLACRYALSYLGDHPGGAWYCELAGTRSLDEILAAVADALEVDLRDEAPARQIGHALAGRDGALILLDNFEQIAQHAGATVACWMRAAKGCRFLVTSRELLGIEGEYALPLAPLSTPTEAGLDNVRSNEAAALFTDRARAVSPSFAITESNAASVAELVRLLDGLPLAIELAAARIRVLSPAKIIERLGKRFALLRSGKRQGGGRHGTLREAIDWSWRLCAPWEQLALAQCSVFSGSFCLAAAEAVLDTSAWPDTPWPMDVVQALVDKSLLRSWQPEAQLGVDIEEQRFGMYLCVQEYAAEKLGDPLSVPGPNGGALTGPEQVIHAERRHGQRYAELGRDDAVEALYGPAGRRGWSVLATERQNISAALNRAVERVDSELAGPLAQAYALVSGGSIASAVLAETLQRVLDQVDLEQTSRARLWCEIGAAAGKASFGSKRSRRAFKTAVEIARHLGDVGLEARALIDSTALGPAGERYAESIGMLKRARPMAEEVGDRRYVVRADSYLGMHHSQLGEIAAAQAAIERCLAGARSLGDRRAEGAALLGLAIVHELEGQRDQTLRKEQEALAVARDAGDRQREGHLLAIIADHYQLVGQPSEAKLVAIEAMGILRPIGSRRSEGMARYSLAMANMQLAELNEAETQIAEALEAIDDSGDRHERCIALTCRARIEHARGRQKAARSTLDEAETIIADLGIGSTSQPAMRLAETRAALGCSKGRSGG